MARLLVVIRVQPGNESKAMKCVKCRAITQHEHRVVFGSVPVWRCLVYGTTLPMTTLSVMRVTPSTGSDA